MTTTQTETQVQQWTNLAQQLRVDSIRATTTAGSGHPTSSMSAADLMSVLLISYLRYDFDDPRESEQRSPHFLKRSCFTPAVLALQGSRGHQR